MAPAVPGTTSQPIAAAVPVVTADAVPLTVVLAEEPASSTSPAQTSLVLAAFVMLVVPSVPVDEMAA
jgi:Na+/serine symporter